MREIYDLPNDVVAEIRKACFEMFLKHSFYSWKPVLGCISNRNYFHKTDFIVCAASWALSYLNSFQPNMMRTTAFMEYLETHKKYCWVDIVLIEVSPYIDDMSSIKLVFQQMFDCVQVSGSDIRIDFKTQIRDWVFSTMDACDVDSSLFEWKPLILKIDIDRQVVYFEDPSDRRKSKRVYNRDTVLPVIHESDDNPIPWLVYVP